MPSPQQQQQALPQPPMHLFRGRQGRGNNDEKTETAEAAKMAEATPTENKAQRNWSTTIRGLESIELDETSKSRSRDDNDNDKPEDHHQHQHHEQQQRKQEEEEEDAVEQFHLKRGCQMLPLVKIRPTIGMNLIKQVRMCGAVCTVQDVGGKLTNLWERYYADADAVIFVWKLDNSNNNNNNSNNNAGGTTCEDGDINNNNTDGNGNDDDDDDDHRERRNIPFAYQQQLLEKVRASVADDVPFLVLGHYYHSASSSSSSSSPSVMNHLADTLYSTATLLPRYHNPVQAVAFGNAATGAGIKFALEWTVALAKRQQQIREQDDQQQQQQQFSFSAAG